MGSVLCPSCDKSLRLDLQLNVEHTPEGWFVTMNEEQFALAARAHMIGTHIKAPTS